MTDVAFNFRQACLGAGHKGMVGSAIVRRLQTVQSSSGSRISRAISPYRTLAAVIKVPRGEHCEDGTDRMSSQFQKLAAPYRDRI